MRRALIIAGCLLVAGAVPATAEDTFVLTVQHVGRDGGPAARYETSVINKGTGEYTPVPEGAIKLHAGAYALQTTIRGERTTDFLSYPNLDMTRDVSVDLDARQAKPLVVRPPEPAARLVHGRVDVAYSPGLELGSLDGVAIAHLGPRTAGTSSLINTQWQGKDFYGLAWFHDDGLPNGFHRAPSRHDLAKVHVKFGASAPGKTGWRTALPATGPADSDTRGTSAATVVSLPSERTEYYNTETYWVPIMYQLKGSTPADIEHWQFPRPKRYGARTYRENFHLPVIGPALPDAGFPTSAIERFPDRLSVWVPMFSDGAGNAGRSTTDKARTVLYRDGVQVGEYDAAGSGVFDLPPEDSAYRLESSASRTGVAKLSSQVSVAWTFRSSAARTGLVPLSTIRFAPIKGSPVVPVFLREQRSEVDHVARRLSVEFSTDEGVTWKAARVLGNAAAVIDSPPGLVSLRAKATDRHGNTVEQTIINAYVTGQGNE